MQLKHSKSLILLTAVMLFFSVMNSFTYESPEDTSVKNGNWFDIEVWKKKVAPNRDNQIITIKDTVILDKEALIKDLIIEKGGLLRVSKTGKLVIMETLTNKGSIIVDNFVSCSKVENSGEIFNNGIIEVGK